MGLKGQYIPRVWGANKSPPQVPRGYPSTGLQGESAYGLEERPRKFQANLRTRADTQRV